MSLQLIFTSAPRGLTLGRSGFCTVARHREISDSLASALERCSAYERPGESNTGLPVIHAYRIIRIGSSTFHVLTRIQDAGLDYTQRGNHLARHLIFLPGELLDSPTPADVFLNWKGWLENWTGAPRHLGPSEQPSLDSIPASVALPARTWRERSGDAGHAALLVQPRFRRGAILTSSVLPPAQALRLLGESLLLVEPDDSGLPGPWSVPFTTRLQAHEQEDDFSWRCEEAATPDLLSSRRGLPVLSFDSPSWPPLAHPALAKRAREGDAPLRPLKDTARLPDFSSQPEDPETAPGTSRATSSAPLPSPRRAPASNNTPLFIVSALLLLILVLGGAWFLTRSSSSPASPSLAEQLAPLQVPGQREALRQFLREHPASTGDSETDSALKKAAVWLEASDVLEQLQFLRRQEQVAALQEALHRAQNLPQLSDLKAALPRLAYEMEEAQNWLALKTAPPSAIAPAPASSVPASEPLSLARFFGPRPVCLAAISPDRNLTVSRFPEAMAWMDNPEKNSARHIRIFPLNRLPLAGEGIAAKSQPRRNRSDPLRFYQGVHLLFEMREAGETDEGRVLEFTCARDFDAVSPPGTFGRVLQFEDASGPLFSIFALKQGGSDSLLRLPRAMIDFDPGIPGYRLRRELYRDAKITLAGQATASLGLPAAADPSPSSGTSLAGADSWEKLPSPSAADLPALVLRLHFPGADETGTSCPLILFEGGTFP